MVADKTKQSEQRQVGFRLGIPSRKTQRRGVHRGDELPPPHAISLEDENDTAKKTPSVGYWNHASSEEFCVISIASEIDRPTAHVKQIVIAGRLSTIWLTLFMSSPFPVCSNWERVPWPGFTLHHV